MRPQPGRLGRELLWTALGALALALLLRGTVRLVKGSLRP